MSSFTGKLLNLIKPAVTDNVLQTIADLASNFQKIDDEHTSHKADTAADAHVISNITGLQTALNGKEPLDANIMRKNVSQTMSAQLTAQNNTAYTTAQVRNIILSTADASGGGDGDIWIKYV